MIENAIYSARSPTNPGQLKGGNSIINNKVREALVRWQWLVAVLIALAVIIAEVVEHHPDGLSDLDPDFMPEILIFGVAFPLVIWLLLGMLAHNYKSEAAQTTVVSNGITGHQTSRRVLIVEVDLVMGAVIESLLANNTDLELIGSATSSEAELIKEINQSQAEAVILSTVTKLTDPIKLLALHEHYPRLRVVVMSANENLVQIYDKRQISVNRASDLANIIRGNARRPRPKTCPT